MSKVAKRIVPITAAWGLAVSVYAQDLPPAPPANDSPNVAVPQAAPGTPDAASEGTHEVPASFALPAEAPPAGAAATELPEYEIPTPGTPPAVGQPGAPAAEKADELVDGLDPKVVEGGQMVLAERFGEISQRIVREGKLDEAAFRQGAALIRASTALSPKDSRFWRLLTEAEIQLGDSDGLLAALNGYRKAAPDDRLAQIQIIELYTARMQSADKELDYLRGIFGKESIPPEVRSHTAVMMARRQIERGETTAVLESLDRAIELNDVNVAALEMKYQILATQGSVADRSAALVALVKANPVRPGSLGELGRLLAALGLHEDGVDWMNRAIALYGRTGGGDAQTYHDLLIDYVSSLYIGGQTQPARTGLDQILKTNPNDIDAWLLKLVIDRGGADKDAYAKSREGAAAALNARWAAVARRVAGQEEPPAPAPGTPPAAPEATPEPNAVAEQLKAAENPDNLAAFVSAASDFAWFEIYFNEQPGNAGKWVAALESVIPPEDASFQVTLQRLRGWLHLAGNQPDEARAALAPIADLDSLAALGIHRLNATGGDAAAQKTADDSARQFLQDNPFGLIGAIVYQAMKDRQLQPEDHPDAAAVRSMLQKFPRGWLEVADNPQRFYSIRAEPLRVAHRFGEPMWVRVSLQNLTDQDIPIGEDGVIQRGLLFSADEALTGKSVPGVAFERLAQTTVLPARASLPQHFIRLDQGELAEFLNSDPTRRLQITGRVMTNPTNLGKDYGPGLAGYQVPMTKKVTRVGFPIARPAPFDKVAQEIQQGLPDMKIRNLSLLATYAAIFSRNAEAIKDSPDPQAAAQQQQLRALATQAGEIVQRAAEADGEVPAVTQWARFELVPLVNVEGRQAVVESLLTDTRWEGRLLGLIATRFLEPADAEPLITKFTDAEGEEAFVKEYAVQALELLKRPPATQPAEGASPETPVAEPGLPVPLAPSARPANATEPPGGVPVEIPAPAEAPAAAPPAENPLGVPAPVDAPAAQPLSEESSAAPPAAEVPAAEQVPTEEPAPQPK